MIYMNYEGITGPLKGKYQGWIELQSCQLGYARGVGSGSGGSGRESPKISEVVVTKFQDSSSSSLFTEATSGKEKKVKIDFLKAEEAPYLSLEFENTLISSFSISGGGDKPFESLTLNFTKVVMSNKPTASVYDPDASREKMQWTAEVSRYA